MATAPPPSVGPPGTVAPPPNQTSAPSTPSSITSNTGATTASSSNLLPIFDAFLDIPHPACSQATYPPINTGGYEKGLQINNPRIIIAPPAEAMKESMAVGMEVSTDQGLARVARFCFPEFRDDTKAPEQTIPNALNKYDTSLGDYFTSTTKQLSSTPYPYMNMAGPSCHTFAMQLSSGDRVYGHVRRYLPHHTGATKRIDVGRRGLRAMVIFTRFRGGEKFYQSLMKTLESVLSLRKSTPADLHSYTRPHETFLHYIHKEHARIAKIIAQEPLDSTRSGRSNPDKFQQISLMTKLIQKHTVSFSMLELGYEPFKNVDMTKFVIPPDLLTIGNDSPLTSSPILPLLRCLGISNTLRLFSAMLCERRIILTSAYPSRLSTCANAATVILAQGLLYWAHIYIPVLPPGMINYLAAPMPYLVGLVSSHAHLIKAVQGLGEVLVVHLDQNELQTHNMSNPDQSIPDILQAPMSEYGEVPSSTSASIAEMLSSDLMNVMKMDKKIVKGADGGGGGTVSSTVMGTAADKIKKRLQKFKGTTKKVQDGVDGGVPTVEDEVGDMAALSMSDFVVKESYTYGEGFGNEVCEEEVRIAFVIFFVCLIGDMKIYLRPGKKGQVPSFDKELFLECHKRLGNRETSAMYPMINLFKESQIFEQFVKSRVAEIQIRKPVTLTAPVFSYATNHHRVHRISFASTMDVRRIVRETAHINPGRFIINWTTSARNRTMDLTSNNRNELVASEEMRKLVQTCRDGTYALTEVMGVLWERLRDSRGMQWKHGLYALQVIKELILQGPITAVSEAMNGLGIIRKMKFYENMRTVATVQVKSLAVQVYNILVNRARLFSMRRVCALRRRQIEAPPPAKRKDKRLHIRMKFKDAHSLLHPSRSAAPSQTGNLLETNLATPTIPASSGPSQTSNTPANIQSAQGATYGNDLLSLSFASPTPNDKKVTPASPTPKGTNDSLHVFSADSATKSPLTTSQPFGVSTTMANNYQTNKVASVASPTMTASPPTMAQVSQPPHQYAPQQSTIQQQGMYYGQQQHNNYYTANQHQQNNASYQHGNAQPQNAQGQVYYQAANNLQYQQQPQQQQPQQQQPQQQQQRNNQAFSQFDPMKRN